MKSYNKLLILSLLPILFACEKVSEIIPDDVNKEQPEVVAPVVPEGRTISVSATSDGPATKTTLAETSVLWDEGDKFSIVNAGTNVVMTLSGEAGSTHGDFSGTVAEKDVIDDSARAIFPSSAFSSFVDGNITLSIPQHQTYVPGSFDHSANIMVGKVTATGTDSYSASFKNMMGVLKLSLTGYKVFIDNISVTDKSGKSLWGTATFYSASFTDGITSDELEGGSETIILDCNCVELDEVTPTTFYFVVPAGSFNEGFEVSVNTMKNGSATFGTTRANTVDLNVVKPMPAIAITSDMLTISEFNIENSALATYLNKGAYSKWGATSHFGLTSLNQLRQNSIDQDYPESKTVHWQGTGSATYNVSFTDVTSHAEVYKGDRIVSDTSHSLYNMIPEHVYAYSVSDGNGLITGELFKATGRVRMVKVDDTWNFRDMGGWTSGLGNRTVVFGLLYRCGSLNGVWQKPVSTSTKYTVQEQTTVGNYVFSEQSRQQLLDLGIKAELDLRKTYADETDMNATDFPHGWSLGLNHTGIPDSEYDYVTISSLNAMKNPLTDDAFVRDIDWIIDRVFEDKPVAFHCKSGADRTGAVAYIVYSLLGVSEGNIALEFEITNMSHEQNVVKGKSEFRNKLTSSVDDAIYTKGFTTLGKGSRQKNAYYYLNSYFQEAGRNGATISSEKLNAFIEKMLGMEPGEYNEKYAQ